MKRISCTGKSNAVPDCKCFYPEILIFFFKTYQWESFCSLHRYLLNLNKSSDDAPDPCKEAVVDTWVEWESKSLQVSCLRRWNCCTESVKCIWENSSGLMHDSFRTPNPVHRCRALVGVVNFYSVSTHPEHKWARKKSFRKLVTLYQIYWRVACDELVSHSEKVSILVVAFAIAWGSRLPMWLGL